ncbi:hypothetical protein R3P38DRAFT_3057644, partial [Favolaschia claudopus]
ITGLSQVMGTVFSGIAPSIASSLFALSLKRNMAGGYLVYIVLVGITCGGLRCSLLLPRRLSSDSDRVGKV